ncbi:peptidoglycan-recognition protein LF [Drosophila innubila]|uniref:peptidoglycan-recognition protein LF n=1 Tax=Drosophila innubila TaxID=198719 RepID=UPI00148CC023|nr:peptidoglycan-recognition protein LF [Drosophila innubila]
MKNVQTRSENVEDQAAHTNGKHMRGLIWLCGVLMILVSTAIVYFVWMMTRNVDTLSRGLRILDRSEWLGEPPSRVETLIAPISHVIIHHTATEGCEREEECIYRMRMIQTFHMKSMGFTDIAYNFLVGGDGQVYVGRGWQAQGQHVRGYGAVSISIAFIGTFISVPPKKKQLWAARRLMEEGVRLHKLDTDYHIYAHRQLSATESPGEKLFELMKLWPRWSEDVITLRRLNQEPLRLVDRPVWLAQPSVEILLPLQLPVKKVRFECTSSDSCDSQASCTFRIRFLQTFHIESDHHKDINYNFVVGGDGNVYVGRGWNHSCDVPQFEGIVVGFVCQSKPTTSQRKIANELLSKGIKLGNLSSDYQLIDDLD